MIHRSSHYLLIWVKLSVLSMINTSNTSCTQSISTFRTSDTANIPSNWGQILWVLPVLGGSFINIEYFQETRVRIVSVLAKVRCSVLRILPDTSRIHYSILLISQYSQYLLCLPNCSYSQYSQFLSRQYSHPLSTRSTRCTRYSKNTQIKITRYTGSNCRRISRLFVAGCILSLAPPRNDGIFMFNRHQSIPGIF